MKDSTIKCDAEDCGALFHYTDIEIHKETLESVTHVGLQRRYFCCPVCNTQYTIDVTDLQLRQDIREFKRLCKKHERLMAKQSGEIKLRNSLVKINAQKESIKAREVELKRMCK